MAQASSSTVTVADFLIQLEKYTCAGWPLWGARRSNMQARSLRCEVRSGAALRTRNFCRKRLAVSPHRSILKVFFLPDGHGALERINQPAASIERRRAVGGSDHHQHAGLADLQPPQPVYHRNVADLKLFQRLLGQTFHLPQCHLLISFVIEVECPTPARLVAHHALEDNRSPVPALLHASKHSWRVDGIADNQGVPPPATNRRQQRHLVAGLQPSLTPGVFLVHR